MKQKKSEKLTIKNWRIAKFIVTKVKILKGKMRKRFAIYILENKIYLVYTYLPDI